MLEHEQLLTHPKRWEVYYADRPCWVFTHRDLPWIPGVDVGFVQGVVRAAYDDMMNARPGQNVWLVGGGDLVGQFADADLLGQISLGMAPVTLGEGEAAAAATVDLHSVEVPGSAAGRATAPRRARRRAQITTTADRQL